MTMKTTPSYWKLVEGIKEYTNGARDTLKLLFDIHFPDWTPSCGGDSTSKLMCALNKFRPLREKPHTIDNTLRRASVVLELYCTYTSYLRVKGIPLEEARKKALELRFL